MAERSCDKCNLCCIVYQLDFLNKPAGTLCHFYDPEVGCSIHNKPEQHPVCRGYKCLYKNEAIDLPRPDTVGYVFEYSIVVDGLRIVAVKFKEPVDLKAFSEVVDQFEKDNPGLTTEPIVYWTKKPGGYWVCPRGDFKKYTAKQVQEIIDKSQGKVRQIFDGELAERLLQRS